MIANALSHDSPPSTPARRSDNRLSITVSNTQGKPSGKTGEHIGNYHFTLPPIPFPFPSLVTRVCLPFFWNPCLTLLVFPPCLSVVSQPADEGTGMPTVKRRRVTAEMEGKYIINMPKGTTPRTRRILAQQAKKGRPDPVASTGNPLN